jgi:hypothetical protein
VHNDVEGLAVLGAAVEGAAVEGAAVEGAVVLIVNGRVALTMPLAMYSN